MGKAGKWLGRGVAAVLLLPVVVFALSRIIGPTPGQRAALEQLELRTMPEGRNGFAALWLLPWAVPEAQHEEIAQADGDRFRPGGSVPKVGEALEIVVPTSVAGGRYAGVRIEDGQAGGYCPMRADDCLDRVEADPGRYLALLQRDAALFERIEALAGYDHFSNPFAAGFGVNMAAWQLLGRSNTRHAYDFIDGRVGQALERTCRDAGVARQLVRDADQLSSSMVAHALFHGRAELFAEMLARLPVDQPLPAECTQAFALPSPADFSLCGTAGGEFRYMRALQAELTQTHAVDSRWQAVLTWLAFNQHKFDARSAQMLAHWCSEASMSGLAAGQPAPGLMPVERGARYWFHCADDFVGCVSSDIQRPAYRDYPWRAQDSRARLHLLNATLWLRANRDPDQALAQQIASLPESISLSSRRVRLGADRSSLEIDLYMSRPSPTWSVPLPREWAPAAVDGS